MNRNDFFERLAVSDDPLLFTNEHRARIDRLKERLGDLTGKRVLEPGCGVGPLTEYLAAWVGPRGHVLACDASCGMTEECRARLGPRENVEVIHASVETLKLQPESWNLVILFRVFPHFEDKTAVLRHLRPCLARGGRLVIANLEGSIQLNALHAGFSAPVRHDRMPSGEKTACDLEANGFYVHRVIDEYDEFFAEATVCTNTL